MVTTGVSDWEWQHLEQRDVLVVIERSDAGKGSSFATSGTAADFASMLPFCIVITVAPFSSYPSPPLLQFLQQSKLML